MSLTYFRRMRCSRLRDKVCHKCPPLHGTLGPCRPCHRTSTFVTAAKMRFGLRIHLERDLHSTGGLLAVEPSLLRERLFCIWSCKESSVHKESSFCKKPSFCREFSTRFRFERWLYERSNRTKVRVSVTAKEKREVVSGVRRGGVDTTL